MTDCEMEIVIQPNSQDLCHSMQTKPDETVSVPVVSQSLSTITIKPDLTKVNQPFFNQLAIGKHLQSLCKAPKVRKVSNRKKSLNTGAKDQIKETKESSQELVVLSVSESDDSGIQKNKCKEKRSSFTKEESKILLRAILNEEGQKNVLGTVIWKKIFHIKVSLEIFF